MNITFEPALDADASLLIEVQNKAFYSDYVRYGFCPGYGRTEQSMLNSIHTSDVYKIVKEEEIIGNISVSPKGNAKYYLGGLCIIPEYEGLGIGQAALMFIENKYTDATHWSLETPADKERNHRFYMKSGYSVTKKYWDKNVEVVLFEKNVN